MHQPSDKGLSYAALRDCRSVPENLSCKVSKKARLRKYVVETTRRPTVKSIVPPQIAAPFARYSQGIEIPAGARLLRSSGQLGVDETGQVPEGAEAQATLCFSNIGHILTAAGMGARNVFHVSAFVTDRSHMAGYMAARDAFLSEIQVLPTSTLMIVSGFTREEFVVEVEVWAAD